VISPTHAGAKPIPRPRSASTPPSPRGGDDQVSPQKIIAQGTDWRFITELKKELKG